MGNLLKPGGFGLARKGSGRSSILLAVAALVLPAAGSLDDAVPSVAPMVLVATGDAGGIHLSWTYLAIDGGEPPAFYTVYRILPEAAAVEVIAVVADGSTFFDESVASGAAAGYFVIATLVDGAPVLSEAAGAIRSDITCPPVHTWVNNPTDPSSVEFHVHVHEWCLGPPAE